MKTLILTLLLAIPAFAQHSNVIKEYDRFEDRTKYWTTRTYPTNDLDVMAHFSFKGKGAGREIGSFYLIFTSKSSEWRYLKDSRLFFLIDGERLEIGSAKTRDGDVKAGYSTAEVKEILVYPITYQTLQKISKAARINVRLGSTEFEMKQHFQDSVKELLSKVQVVKTQ